MSGGSYEYVSYRFNDAANTLRARHGGDALLLALAEHLDRLADVMHDIEWADSGDTSWTPDLREQVRGVLARDAELVEARMLAERAMEQIREALASGGPK